MELSGSASPCGAARGLGVDSEVGEWSRTLAIVAEWWASLANVWHPTARSLYAAGWPRE